MDWVKRLGIKNFRGIYSRDGLPKKIRKECGIINLDDIKGPGTHWVCYRNLGGGVASGGVASGGGGGPPPPPPKPPCCLEWYS